MNTRVFEKHKDVDCLRRKAIFQVATPTATTRLLADISVDLKVKVLSGEVCQLAPS